MKIETYFRNKGPFVALTKAEALILGIPFPPRAGWLQRHGPCAIGPEQERILAQLRIHRKADDETTSTTPDMKQMSLFEEL